LCSVPRAIPSWAASSAIPIKNNVILQLLENEFLKTKPAGRLADVAAYKIVFYSLFVNKIFNYINLLQHTGVRRPGLQTHP
jgi:hypothetical protein